jgi:hypothetical protein
LNYVADNYTRLESFVRNKGRIDRSKAAAVVSHILDRADRYIARFESGEGPFGPPDFDRATPFDSTVEPFVWMQARFAIADVPWKSRERPTDPGQLQQGMGATGPTPGGTIGEPANHPDDKLELAKDARRTVLKAIRQELTQLDLRSPDLLAMKRSVNLDRMEQLLDPIVRRFLVLLEYVERPTVPADKTADLVHAAFLESAQALEGVSTANRNQITHRFPAEPGFAVATAMSAGLEELQVSNNTPLAAAHWNLSEMVIELRRAQVVPVAERLGRRFTTDAVSSLRFEANLTWLDQLIDWLDEEAGKPSLALIAREALAALHSTERGKDSAIKRATAIAHTEHRDADQAQDLLALEERLRHIEEEGSQP